LLKLAIKYLIEIMPNALSESTEANMGRPISINAVYLLLGQYANRAILFVFYIMLARTLGDAVVGEYAIATTYGGLVFIVASFGIERLVLREVSRHPGVVVRALVAAFRSQVLVWVLVLPFALAITIFLDYNEQTTRTIWILMLWVPCSALYSVVLAVHQALERMDISSMLGVTSALQLLLFGAAVLLLGGGMLGIAVVMIWERLSTSIAGIVLIRRDRSFVRSEYSQETFRISSILREAFPFAWLGLLGTLYQRVDVLIMPTFVSEADIGQYATAYRILEALLVLPAMVASAAFPVMARSVHNDFPKYRNVSGKSLQYSFVSAGLAIGVLFTFAEPIIEAIFGTEFLYAGNLLRILVWGLIFQSINNTLGRCMIAADLERYFIPLATLALASNVFINMYLLPRIGVVGAAVATLGSYGVSTMIHFFVTWRHNVMPDFRLSLLTIASFAVAITVAVALFSQGFGYVSGLLGIFAYLFCLFYFRVLSFRQVCHLRRQFSARL
jgi:O-antigen/teichoic acid export membrane protein